MSDWIFIKIRFNIKNKKKFYLIFWYFLFFNHPNTRNINLLTYNLKHLLLTFEKIKIWTFLQTSLLTESNNIFFIKWNKKQQPPKETTPLKIQFMEFSYLNLPSFLENNAYNDWFELKKFFSQTCALLNKKKILNSWSSFLFMWLKQTTSVSFKNHIYLNKKQFLLLNMGFCGGFNHIKKNEQFLTYQYDLNNAYISTYNYYFPFKLINFKFLTFLKKCNLNQIYGFFWVFNIELHTYQLLYIDELKILCLLNKNKKKLILIDGLFYLRSKLLSNFFISLVQTKQKNMINKLLFKILGNYLYGNLASNKLFLFINFYNNQKQLRPIHLSFVITSVTRMYLLKYLKFYFKTATYTDTDSLHCSSPIHKKFLKNKIFFFKQVHKNWVHVLCSFYFDKKVYFIFYINLNTFHTHVIIKYKGLNYETQNLSFFQTKKFINFTTNKNKTKLSYKLLRNQIN